MAKVSDLTVRDNKYWSERFEKNSDYMFNFGDDIIPDINRLYKSTSNNVNDRVERFYKKYGTTQSSPTYKTLSDGTKVVSGTSNKLVVTQSAANKKLTNGTRLDKLKRDIYSDLVDMSKVQNNLMKSQLSVVAEQSVYDMYYELYRGYGVGTSFNVLSPTVVNQLMLNPVNGQNFSTRVWNNRDLLANQVNQILTNGIIQGKSNGQMVKELSDRMNAGRNVANRLIRTEVTNTYNQAAMQGYRDSGLVAQYEYIATLDNRTSEICSALDGQVFDVNKAITGVNIPPMHPNCRSTTAAYFDNSREGLTRVARGLGGNTFTVPGSMDNANFKAIYVNKTMTRKQWDAGKRTPDTRGEQLRKSVRIEQEKRLK